RETGALFPMLFVGLSNITNKKFAKIADDLCVVQLLSFCVPILARDKKTEHQYEMRIRSWIIIGIVSFSIGGMSNFASTYPAESTEELLMFINSTFPHSGTTFHENLLNWLHNWTPYAAGFSTKFIPDFGQKRTLQASLTGLAISCTCSLIAVLSPQ
ncbi:hypothetical protein PMAYCL1PPCAC_28099, partial [Pristionchus mayeri]